MKKLMCLIMLFNFLLIANNVNAQSIKRFTESSSNFNKGPDISGSNYPVSEMYRAYKKGRTGAASVSKIQNQVENKIREFAKKEGKGFVIIAQRTSDAPYLFGNYPRVEIIFVLTEKK